MTFEIDTSPIFSEGGDCSHIVTLSRDITDARRMDAQFRRSEERIRSLIEQLPVGLMQQDYTAVKVWLDSLRDAGIEDLRAYLATYPEEVVRGIRLIGKVDVNPAGLAVFEADDTEQLNRSAERKKRLLSIGCHVGLTRAQSFRRRRDLCMFRKDANRRRTGHGTVRQLLLVRP